METQGEVRDTLLEAKQHIRELAQNPEPPKTVYGKKVITQNLVEAQLFCRDTSEFHVPGYFPWPVS